MDHLIPKQKTSGISCSITTNEKGEPILPKREDTDFPGVYIYFNGKDEVIGGKSHVLTISYIGSANSDDTTLKKSQWKNDGAHLIEQRLLSIFSTTLNDHSLGGVHHGLIQIPTSNGSPVDILKTLANMNLNKPESAVIIYHMAHPSIKDKALDVITHLSQTAAFDKMLQ